jgi:hypothetical protein
MSGWSRATCWAKSCSRSKSPVPRPRSVTLLALWVLVLAAYNLLGAVASAQRYTVLNTLPLSLPPAYLIAAGVVWAVVFGVLAVGLWRLRAWARWGTLAAATLYVALGAVERLVFARADYARESAPYFLALHAAWLAWVAWTLLRPRARRSFSA